MIRTLSEVAVAGGRRKGHQSMIARGEMVDRNHRSRVERGKDRDHGRGRFSGNERGSLRKSERGSLRKSERGQGLRGSSKNLRNEKKRGGAKTATDVRKTTTAGEDTKNLGNEAFETNDLHLQRPITVEWKSILPLLVQHLCIFLDAVASVANHHRSILSGTSGKGKDRGRCDTIRGISEMIVKGIEGMSTEEETGSSRGREGITVTTKDQDRGNDVNLHHLSSDSLLRTRLSFLPLPYQLFRLVHLNEADLALALALALRLRQLQFIYGSEEVQSTTSLVQAQPQQEEDQENESR